MKESEIYRWCLNLLMNTEETDERLEAVLVLARDYNTAKSVEEYREREGKDDA